MCATILDKKVIICKNILRGGFVFIYFVLFLIIFLGNKNSIAKDNECHYNLGVTPQYDVRYLHSTWAPVLKILTKKTGCIFAFTGSKSAIEFEENLKQGKFDLAYVNPVQVVIGYLSNGYVPFLRSKSKRLKGIIVVRKDDTIQDISELNGEKVVFPAYIDIEAALLPKIALKEKIGITVQTSHVKTHSSVYLHVGKKLARAGGGSYTSLNNQKQYIKDSLRVLYETDEIYPYALIIHGLIDEDNYNTIHDAFMEINKEAPELLKTISLDNPIQADIDEYMYLEKWIQQ